MPRIPETEIERIKQATDLVALIQSRGVKLKQQGKNWTGLCPFHNDTKTPNLIVTPCKGLFRCMAGSCGKTGNALHFVQWYGGVSFRHAFEILNNGKASEQSGGTTVPKLPCPVDTGADDAKMLAKVADYYHKRLIKTPAALDYLRKRGLDCENLIEKFNLGFSDRTLGLRLPNKDRKDGAEMRGKLTRLGVYRKSGHEHLNGCLVVSVINAKGELVQMYGRRIDPKAPKDKRHLYLARPLAGIFNPEALKNRELILTESILDALTFYRHGMEAVTCTYGTENLTSELFGAIKTAGIETLRIAYDNDEAGERAFVRDAERFIEEGITVYRVKFPWGSDANSYALAEGGEALRKAVRDAVWYADGKANKSNSTVPS